MQIDSDNQWFQRAANFVNDSERHLFLTGKAGTGKTTFLQYIRRTTHKRSVVLAPTGVAAINAGGVTLHSFFQLPFGPFVPSGASGWNSQYSTAHRLISNIRFSQEKKDLLKELELLIIDEISMVRSDMLDAVDLICRHVRQHPNLPFGGLQLLYIGDLFQLPPVIKDEEWEKILSPHYRSPFFFDAKVIEEVRPLVIELKKIYRQEEGDFIDLLNQVRNAQLSDTALELLNSRLDRSYKPAIGESVITLSSHNSKAHAINDSQLHLLRSVLFCYEAEISGDFPEKAYPAESKLCIKEGAQVMFIKNDKGETRKYYNGKLATVSRLIEDKVFVTMDSSTVELEVEKEEWTNIRYHFNRDTQSVEEEEIGSFKQFPLRLAWAITIHKSQGLTFEKAIVDAGSSFAAGQVYVALSRLTTLQGLILRSYIPAETIRTDHRVLDFVRSEMEEKELDELLDKEKKLFIRRSFLRFFNFTRLFEEAVALSKSLTHRAMPDKVAAAEWHQQWNHSIEEMESVASRFRQQLTNLIDSAASELQMNELKDRVDAACRYFSSALDIRQNSLQEQANLFRIKARTKKYVQDLSEMNLHIDRYRQTMDKALRLSRALREGQEDSSLMKLIAAPLPAQEVQEADNSVPRPKKGETQKISLDLFLQGLSVDDIAKERGLVVGTIESHLIGFIKQGTLPVEQFVPAEKINMIRKAAESIPATELSSKMIKDKLGETISYNEIRAVLLGSKTN